MSSCGDAVFFDVAGNLIWNLRFNDMEEANDAFGEYGLKLVVRKIPEDGPYLIGIGLKKKENHTFLLEQIDCTVASFFFFFFES